MQLIKKQQHGFTIVELMIATVVFSVVLLIVTAGVLSFSRQYIKGQTSNQVQASTTAAMNQVSQDAQFSHGFDDSAAAGGSTSGCYQIGTDLYSYNLGVPVSSTEHALVMAPSAAGITCGSGTPTMPNDLITAQGARELLATNMRLLAFSVNAEDPPNQQILDIVLRTGYGSDDLLRKRDGTNLSRSGMTDTDWAGVHCAGGIGDQYCTTMQLNTSVQQRL